ncbi:MAG TPA: tetratricopeptide repeat protein, partial [Nannocystaceae bacterium]|nr:tetratricopeptide repeat protein [Nannocystaceae bacterium]
LRFFIEQGFEEDAHTTYLELERRCPGHPALAEFAGRFATSEVPADAPVVLDEEVASDLAALASPSAAHSLAFEDEDEDDDDDFLSAIFDEPAAVQRPKAKQAPRARAEIGGGADPRTLFDLGTAYREMGLIDDALGQFSAASADPQWRARSLVMMASLHLHRGAIPKAIEDLQEAVRSAVTDDEASEARYELGVIYQVMGETAKAIVELDAVKPGYRDRDARLAGLRRG